MDLIEAEHPVYYEPVWEAFVAHVVKASCALEDRESARKWAGLVAELNRAPAYTGEDRGWDAWRGGDLMITYLMALKPAPRSHHCH